MSTPALTLRVLRPIANFIALNISPWQTASVVRDYGFKGEAKNPAQAEAFLIEAFEGLDNRGETERIKALIEELLTLFGRMANENQNRAFQKRIVELLHHGYFTTGFNPSTKSYILMPFEGHIKEAIMRAHGLKEKDVADSKWRYDPETGKGQIRDRAFRLKSGSSEHSLFTAAWEPQNKRVERSRVLILIGLYREGEKEESEVAKRSATQAINRIVGKIRDKTSLTRNEFVQNGGSVTLLR